MIPPKIFGRMLDLLIRDHDCVQSGSDDRSHESELLALQEQYGWPQKASDDQRSEWERLYNRIDQNEDDLSSSELLILEMEGPEGYEP